MGSLSELYPYFQLNPILNDVYISVEVSFLYFIYLVSIIAGGPGLFKGTSSKVRRSS